MAAYLMSERVARWVRGQMNARQAPPAAVGQTRSGRPMAVQDDSFAAPYEVRWAASAEDWIIWLPDECLSVDGEAIDLTEDLEAAGGAYPEGWYKLGLDESATAVYLNLYLPPEGGEDEEPQEPSGEFSAEASTEDDTWPVLVATIEGKSVRQTVASALVISGLGGGVRWLNDMAGELYIRPDEDASIEVDGKTYYISVRREAEDGHIFIGLTEDPPDPEGGAGYCNAISHEAEDLADIPNDISNDDAGGGEVPEGGASMEDPANAISRWPCKKSKSE